VGECIWPSGFLWLPGKPGGTLGLLVDDFVDVAMLGMLTALK
jgi:hypothetical protein